MASDLPAVRYTPDGTEGARAVLRLEGEESLLIEWAGHGSEPVFSGTDRLTTNPMLCASLFDFTIATKAVRSLITQQEFDEQARIVEDRVRAEAAEDERDDEDETGDSEDGGLYWLRKLRGQFRPQLEDLEQTRIRLVENAREAEVSLLDFAEILGFGESESDESEQSAWCSVCLGFAVHKKLAMPRT